MTLIVENGSGVHNANSYIDAAYVTAHLAARNRVGENGWTTPEATEEDAACIEGTNYIELRFRESFRGAKEFRNVATAKATLTLTAQPSADDVVVVGSVTYKFASALVAANDVLIGASVSASIDNLVDAINGNGITSGSTFHGDTVANEDATAVTFVGDALVAFSSIAGTAGNAVVATTDITGASWNSSGTLVGGADIIVPQPLSFPRRALIDYDGIPVVGIPERLKQAAAEYSVRARPATTVLAPDPTVDDVGGVLTKLREKVGPIETETVYQSGTANNSSLPAYPAADRLLREYLRTGGGVIRG